MTLTAMAPELLRLRAKARHEIGEKEDLIQSQILALRNHIASENVCSLPPKSYDSFLLKCLRARKYDLDRAAKTYKKYCQLKQRSDEIADYMVPSQYNTLLKGRFVCLLNKRDHLGRQILMIQVQKWNPSKADLDEVLASLFMMVDQATDSTDTQYNGIVVIADFKGFGFSHAKQVSPSRVQCIVNIVQDSYPARFKEFHFLNHPALFNMAFALAKPFLKEKIRKRIFFHGHDLSSLQKSVSPSLLPSFLGGTVPENECHDEEALNSLLKKDDYYEGMRQSFNLIEACQDYNE